MIDPGPAERPYTSADVDNARHVLGLPRNRFADVGGGIGAVRIVARCEHCATLFVARSHDLADLDHINRGDCGCQKSKQK